MKKIQSWGIIFFILLLTTNGVFATSLPPVTGEQILEAEAAFLIDVGTGKILYEKNANLPLPPASTTKILTALILIEKAELGEVVQVGGEVEKIGPGSSVAQLKEGDQLTVAELVYALLLPSGNDAAYAAAVFIGRKLSGFEGMDVDEAVKVFVAEMNQRARELGAINSNFVVPDGYDTPGHLTTARDLAMIALAAYKQPFIRQVAATPVYHWQGKSWVNTNCLLQQDCPKAYYPWANGLKTGYTGKAGHCLIASAQMGNRELVAVILRSNKERRWEDICWLLEEGFKGWKDYKMFVAGRQVFILPVIGYFGEEQLLEIVAETDWSELLSLEQVRNLQLNYYWRRGAVDYSQKGLALKAPLKKGQVVGRAVISLEGVVLAEVNLLATAWVGVYYWLVPIGILAVLLAVLLIVRYRRLLGTKISPL